MIDIELETVTGSTQIVGLGYHAESQTMRVKFTDYFHKGNRIVIPGAQYDVTPVSPEEFEAQRTAKSKGTHYADTFRKSKHHTITRV